MKIKLFAVEIVIKRFYIFYVILIRERIAKCKIYDFILVFKIIFKNTLEL